MRNPVIGHHVSSAIGLSIALLTALACTGLGGPGEDEGEDPGRQLEEVGEAPDWIGRGCDAFFGDEADARLCAVGSADATGNLSLARVRAIGAARAVIADTLETRISEILDRHVAPAEAGGEPETAQQRQMRIADLARRIVRIGLNGTRLRASWMSAERRLHTLVDLEAEAFTRRIGRMSDLPADVRHAVLERAEASFRQRGEAAAPS